MTGSNGTGAIFPSGLLADLGPVASDAEITKERELCELSLYEFVRAAWPSIDSADFSENWAIKALCDHLEAVTFGDIRRLLINLSPRCGKPVYEDEWVVEKSKGRIRLKDVLVGDSVLTAAGFFGRVAAVHCQGQLPLWKLMTHSGRSLRTAGDHPILTTAGWLPMAKVCPGHFVGLVSPLEDHGAASVSADEARLIGYLIGDGSVQTQPGVTTASESVSRDMEEIAARLGFFTRRQKWISRKSWLVVVKAHPNRWGFKKKRSPLTLWLERFGLRGKTSYTKRVPDALFGATPDVIAEFIGAYWSCDGHITGRGMHNGRVREDCVVGCNSVSRDLMLDIQHLLTRLGIFSRISRREVGIKTKRQGDKYVSWCLNLSRMDDVAKFARQVKIVHDERAARLAAISGLQRTDFDRVLTADKVVSVERDGEGECRCLTIDGPSSTFSANDIAVHNSLISSVCWPAWTWAQGQIEYLSGPQVGFLCGSYGERLSLQNSNICRQLVLSRWYQKFWGHRFDLRADQNMKSHFATSRNGGRIATSVGGSLLGLGGDIVVIDDPHNVEQVESDAERERAIRWWNEVHTTRLNDPKRSAVVVVMQRLHSQDVSGVILDSDEEWTHLCVPMVMDEKQVRRCVTVVLPQYEDEEPWRDERGDGEIMWPERFGPAEITKLRRMGNWFWAGRYQQSPAPAGGGIIRREFWMPWDNVEAMRYGLEWSGARREYPDIELVVGSLDTAYGEKETNDYNALTIWGIWIDRNLNRRAMLMFAWAKRLPLHAREVFAMKGEAKVQYEARQKEAWGLVEWVADTCKRYKVKRLLIEDKTRGKDVSAELRRLYARDNWGIELVDPTPLGGKVPRVHSIVPLFTDNAVYAPDTKWADEVITQCGLFPNAPHDDYVDTVSMFLNWARQHELLVRADEMSAAIEDEARWKPHQETVAESYGV